jgi:hypothetical protein
MISNVQSLAAPAVPFTTVQSPDSSHPPLMPEPLSSDASTGDPMSTIYALLSKQRNNDMSSGKASVEHNQELEKAQQLNEEAAFKKQQDAEANAKAWGIFGKIASVVAIVVSAVASVCSCGAASALCVGACALSAAAFVEGEAHVLTKLTGNPDVDKAFQLGCGIGAAVCSGGAGIAALTTSALVGVSQIASSGAAIGQQVLGSIKDKGCQDVAVALGIGSAVAGAVGAFGSLGNAAKASGDAAKSAVKATADVVNSATELGAGATTMVSAQYQADATDRVADAKQAEQAIHAIQRLTDWVIDAVKESDTSHKHALQTLQGAMQTQAQTLIIASSKV